MGSLMQSAGAGASATEKNAGTGTVAVSLAKGSHHQEQLVKAGQVVRTSTPAEFASSLENTRARMETIIRPSQAPDMRAR